MRKLLLLVIAAALVVLGINNLLSRAEQVAYEAQALRCAQLPDMLGCESFQTAAGPKSP